MIKSKKMVEECQNFTYQLMEQIEQVTKRMRRINGVDTKPLLESIKALVKVSDNLEMQVELIDKSETYQKEKEDKYK